MSITVNPIPAPNSTYGTTAVGQKIILSASSNNTGLDGFYYYLQVQITSLDEGVSTVTNLDFYVSPNPNGNFIFDIAPIINSYISTSKTIGGSSIHAYRDDTNQICDDLQVTVYGEIFEAYNVAGVLTIDLGTVQTLCNMEMLNLTHQIEDGYYPNIEQFKLDGVTKRYLSDRKKDTYKFTLEPLINSDPNAIIIPVREKDYGVITAQAEGSALWQSDNIVVQIFDELGTATSASFYRYSNVAMHMAFYPANLNGSAMALTIKPQDYPNWKFIKVQDEFSKSAPYYLVNIDHYEIHQECKHDNVRIAWVGSRGGWEYFNFNKKNEESVQVERKRYEKVVGTYEAATFGFLPTDAGLKELKPVVQRFITVNSDWIQEGEFEYLKGLIVSDTVHMVLDSGTHIPMLVEQNDYTAARERNGKMKNLTLKLRYANDLNV